MSNTSMQARRMTFSATISTDSYQKAINNALRDPARAKRFIAALTSAVAVNSALQECEASTILSGALLGEGLNLSPSPQLGQYYLVPFENAIKDANGKKKWLLDENGQHILDKNGKWVAETVKQAQFVLGYKGMIQLALRSGQYKRLNVMAIKVGELLSWNPLTEEITLRLIEDDIERDKTPTTGYMATFEYLNGFTKTIYWSREKMESHALRYSKGYAAKKGYTFWEKDFDEMAFKTMLRQLISKWGIMSVDMQTAIEADGATVQKDGGYIHVEETEPLAIDEPKVAVETPSETAQGEEQVSLNDV